MKHRYHRLCEQHTLLITANCSFRNLQLYVGAVYKFSLCNSVCEILSIEWADTIAIPVAVLVLSKTTQPTAFLFLCLHARRHCVGITNIVC